MKLKPLTIKAKRLRQRQTPQEVKLWSRLKNRQCSGYKFRRQVHLGKYIVDFYCPEKKFIVEVDGGQHSHERFSKRDSFRSNYLKNQGCKVIRFWNNDIDSNLEGVYQVILDFLSSPSPLSPLPREERRNER
ncbi:MAG: endonuclease domain-containing protein [Patescibacteria group bacterium]|jgi:very-short-patch-repair endonuclease